MTGALSGLRVLDLSRILAGPYCTQILGDLGADVIKIEKPFAGDDTRFWGPPFLKDADGNDTGESAYYLSINRNKSSAAIDISHPKGQDVLRRLIAQSDVMIENFKAGGLQKYGLGYPQLRETHPRLIYCSITGFGQEGPLAHEPGYDFLAQAMSGLMASTGEPDAPPMKTGVAVSDILTGLNAAIGILAALQAREKTGRGQVIDVALTDCTLSAMTNLAQYYLTSGKPAPRLGNAHSTIVPYQAFAAADGHLIVAVGNDAQFRRFCEAVDRPQWAADPRYRKNTDRVAHRDSLVPLIADIMRGQTIDNWLEILRGADVPCGPVNTMDRVFAMDQTKARSMEIAMEHDLAATPVKLTGSPLKFSATPVQYGRAPPYLGQHTRVVLEKYLAMDAAEIETLAQERVIQIG